MRYAQTSPAPCHAVRKARALQLAGQTKKQRNKQQRQQQQQAAGGVDKLRGGGGGRGHSSGSSKTAAAKASEKRRRKRQKAEARLKLPTNALAAFTMEELRQGVSKYNAAKPLLQFWMKACISGQNCQCGCSFVPALLRYHS